MARRGEPMNSGKPMLDLRKVFFRQTSKYKVLWETIEQDYLLSWVLYGISKTDSLKGKLAFKGGTALKKIYFGDYRFSQDLDFTAINNCPKGEDLKKAIVEACKIAQDYLYSIDQELIISCTRYSEKQLHPNEQEAFVIRGQYRWHSYPHVRVMVEITHNCTVINEPIPKTILHDYPEELNGSILCYTIDEIFGEKLVAMYQNAKKLHERGWSRSRARDYYDLWRLLSSFPKELDPKRIEKTLNKYDFVTYSGIKDFFDPLALEKVKLDWTKWLSPLMNPVPTFEEVVPELQSKVSKFLNLP